MKLKLPIIGHSYIDRAGYNSLITETNNNLIISRWTDNGILRDCIHIICKQVFFNNFMKWQETK